MTRRLSLALAVALLLLRLPSLAQPAGADQSLYAYIGDRILAGGLPYVDAWDQKPPAVHYTYAALRAIWPADGVVAAADLAAAAACAWLLWRLAGQLGMGAAGPAAAIVFLLLSNPSFTRLGGVRLRGQCESFIALAVAAAFVLLARPRAGRSDTWAMGGAGVLFGVAVLYKYNAAVYAAAGLAALWLWRRLTPSSTLGLTAGSALPIAAVLIVFAAAGALADLYAATITYNLQYSGETYRGAFDVVRYLVTFPVERARVDALWTVGGAGCLVLLPLALRDRRHLFPILWVAAACASIAINGSRGLPQYFAQANPALALAAAWGAVAGWAAVRPADRRHRLILASAVALIVGVAVWRVNQFPKLVEQTLFDAQRLAGTVSTTDYLARYADGRKYSSLDSAELAALLQVHAREDQPVYVFGFSGAAYVYAGRVSASRFFWSRPVIAGFDPGLPGYGVAGLLADLEATPPAVVALQKKDWAPDVEDSAAFFLSTPALADWLARGYARIDGPEAFEVWLRRSGPS